MNLRLILDLNTSSKLSLNFLSENRTQAFLSMIQKISRNDRRGSKKFVYLGLHFAKSRRTKFEKFFDNIPFAIRKIMEIDESNIEIE